MVDSSDEDILEEEQEDLQDLDSLSEEDEDEEEVFPEEDLDMEENLESDESLAAPRVRAARTAGLSEQELRERLSNADPAHAIPYSMSNSYMEGDLIDHPRFGLGLVASRVSPQKIQVIFRESPKLLVMNYTPRQGGDSSPG